VDGHAVDHGTKMLSFVFRHRHLEPLGWLCGSVDCGLGFVGRRTVKTECPNDTYPILKKIPKRLDNGSFQFLG
jgi:hypothetical protein